MSEGYPTGRTPDNHPNREPFDDIIGAAITEGDIIRGLAESVDEIEAFSYGLNAVERLGASIEGHAYEVLFSCTSADVRLGELKLPSIINESPIAVSGTLTDFHLIKTDKGIRLGINVINLTIPALEMPEDIDKKTYRCVALTTGIRSYSYTNVS